MRQQGNTNGIAESRGSIAKDVRQKAGNRTFRKIIRIVANTKKEELPALLKKIEELKDKTFIVGDFFKYSVGGRVPQYHGNGFTNLLLNSAREYTVSTKEACKKLSEYVLLEHMSDSAIQQNINSILFEENIFWATLYLLIIEPELGKKILNYTLCKDKVYVMHIRKKSGDVTCYVSWNNGICNLCANEFNTGVWWAPGRVFLSPTTANLN